MCLYNNDSVCLMQQYEIIIIEVHLTIISRGFFCKKESVTQDVIIVHISNVYSMIIYSIIIYQ